jgi:hypothetical protein
VLYKKLSTLPPKHAQQSVLPTVSPPSKTRITSLLYRAGRLSSRELTPISLPKEESTGASSTRNASQQTGLTVFRPLPQTKPKKPSTSSSRSRVPKAQMSCHSVSPNRKPVAVSRVLRWRKGLQMQVSYNGQNTAILQLFERYAPRMMVLTVDIEVE